MARKPEVEKTREVLSDAEASLAVTIKADMSEAFTLEAIGHYSEALLAHHVAKEKAEKGP